MPRLALRVATIAAAALAAAGSRVRSPGLRVRLDDATLAATGTLPISGELTVTLANTTAAATVTLPISGELAVTLANTTLAAEGTTPEVGTTATFTAAPASYNDLDSAWHQGTLGSNAWGEYWRIPSEANPAVGDYVYFTMDGAGVDPGDHVAELAGYTGHVVDLTGPQVTAADRAAAARADVTISGMTIGGSGATFTVTGAIGTPTVGGMHGATAMGAAGTRRMTAQYATSDLSGRVSQSWTNAAGTIVPTAIGMYLDDTATAVRLALYSGGTAGAGGHTSAALVGEILIPSGGAAGWHWAELPSAAVVSIANGTVLRLVAKSNGTAEPGYIAIADLTGTDFANNLEVLDTMSTDPTVAFPSTLAAETADNSNAVYLLAAMQYRSLDGSTGLYTTRWGIQVADPTDLALESSLTAPDSLGAELYFGAPPPPMLGLELDTWAIGWGTAHTTQMRAIVAQGASVGDATGADVLYQAETTGSTTDAWVEYAVAGNVAVDDAETLWWSVKNDAATASFRFALNANRETASPDDNPADFTDASEFEIFATASGIGTPPAVYDTDPSNATATPIDPLTAATANNTNYAAGYLILRVPASTAA